MTGTGLSWAKAAVIELVAVAALAAGISLLIAGASGADTPHAMGGPLPVTVDLAKVAPETAALYRYAADHPADFAQIRCYCGCDAMLGHRNLADCYVTPAGAWDAHASGCAVCADEATTVRRHLDARGSIATASDEINAKYAPGHRSRTG